MPHMSPKRQKKKKSEWEHKEKLLVTTKCPAREHLANTVIEVHVSVSRSFLSLQWLKRGRKKGMREVLQKVISLQKRQWVWANQKMVAQTQSQSLTHHSERVNQIPFWFYPTTDSLVQPLNYTIRCYWDSGPLFVPFKKMTELSWE